MSLWTSWYSVTCVYSHTHALHTHTYTHTESNADHQTVLDNASKMLRKEHNITSTTLQVEHHDDLMEECGTCQETDKTNFCWPLWWPQNMFTLGNPRCSFLCWIACPCLHTHVCVYTQLPLVLFFITLYYTLHWNWEKDLEHANTHTHTCYHTMTIHDIVCWHNGELSWLHITFKLG